MKLHVAAQSKIPGSEIAFHGTEECSELEFGGRTVAFADELRLDGSCEYDGEGFTVKGKVEASLRSECAKCTKLFIEPFSFEFEERFEKTANEDEDVYEYRGDELDLTTMIRDNIFLNLPISSVCSEDCKGLCPVCGCDRNTAQCDCAIEEAESTEERRYPLQALGALLNEDKEV